jgi:UDP-glucuronate 4-epimerase
MLINPHRNSKVWLVTGAAGFIGMSACLNLLKRGDFVIGVDNINDYYDISIKNDRLYNLSLYKNFSFFKLDITDHNILDKIFTEFKPDFVIHLAAQAGVRYSLSNPHIFIHSNILGFTNILESCRHHQVSHLVYASSSSVYGSNTAMPFSEHDNVDHPISLYAATKKSNELLAHTYSHLFQLPTTGLRFFTVYGPWGRPDMALFLFTESIISGLPINVFNNGDMLRDFTYIDDIVEGIIRVAEKPALPNASFETNKPDPATSSAPYRIFNIGNNNPTPLLHYILALEKSLGLTAHKIYHPMQPGDVQATFANTDELNDWIGFKPSTPIELGVSKFVDWYRSYYHI